MLTHTFFKVFLVIMACAKPNFTECVMMDVLKMPNPEVCALNRPGMATFYQTRLDDGWLTFTRCQYVNPEKNRRLG